MSSPLLEVASITGRLAGNMLIDVVAYVMLRSTGHKPSQAGHNNSHEKHTSTEKQHVPHGVRLALGSDGALEDATVSAR